MGPVTVSTIQRALQKGLRISVGFFLAYWMLSGACATTLPHKPAWAADPMQLLVVVEGSGHVTLLDGERFEVVHRFASRQALHGAPQFTQDGRFAYFGTDDGWITKYDLWNLTVVAQVRAGLTLRSLAVSSDDRWVMAANDSPNTLALFDADLNLRRTYNVTTLDRKTASRASAVYDAAPRRSFVVTLQDLPELWEISYDPAAAPIFDGLVHDYKMGEGIATPGFLGVRRTPLEDLLDDVVFDPSFRHAVGATRAQDNVASAAQVVNLDVRRRIASFALPGKPHVGSAITFDWNGTAVLATASLGGGSVTVVDMKTWQVVKVIPTPGPGFFIRSHANSPYAWVDSAASPSAHDTLTVIDKTTLGVVAQVREPGRTLSYIAFTRDGRYVLVGLGERDGALIVLDAKTFKEVKRIPMNQPLGIYTVWNKPSYSQAASH